VEAAALLLLAFAPGLFWLWFFTKRDLYRPEPKRLIAATFGLGMAATVPAAVLSAVFLDDSLLGGGAADLASVAVGMLFVVGPVEETCKYLAVRLYAFRSLYFDEPSDGLVYAAAASLGFASLENLFYILAFGPSVMILRAPLSTAAHVIFGSVWGEALGRRAQGRASGAAALAAALAGAAAVHGLFNVAVTVYPLAGFAIVALGLWRVLRRYRWARRVSPFRLRRNYPQTACRACGRRISAAGRYCRYCGAAVGAQQAGLLWCSHCGQANRGAAAFCTGCGDRLERPRR